MLLGLLASVGLVGVAGVTTVAVLSQDLPDPATLGQLHFDQPTIIYDRTGEVELGRFQRVQRQVVTFKQLPRLVLHAPPAAADPAVWANNGVDPAQNVSAGGPG